MAAGEGPIWRIPLACRGWREGTQGAGAAPVGGPGARPKPAKAGAPSHNHNQSQTLAKSGGSDTTPVAAGPGPPQRGQGAAAWGGITVSPGLPSSGQQLRRESLGRTFQFCLGAGSNPKPGSFSRLNNLAWSDHPWESITDGDQAPSALIKTGDRGNYKWSFVGHSPSRSPAAQAIRPMEVVIRYADLQQGPRGLHSPVRQVVVKFSKMVSPSPLPACPPLISPSGTA